VSLKRCDTGLEQRRLGFPPSPGSARIGLFVESTCWFAIGCGGSEIDVHSKRRNCSDSDVIVGALNVNHRVAAYIGGGSVRRPPTTTSQAVAFISAALASPLLLCCVAFALVLRT
jgi:hypothetical protein